MTDAFKGLNGKLSPFIRLLASDNDGEALNAARALGRALASHGLDFHALAEWIENGGDPSLIAAEIQRVWDQGYGKGYTDGNETGRLSAILASAASIDAYIAEPVDDGVNGYSWLEIAAYCALHKDRFFGNNLEFIESIAEKLPRYGGRPTPKQANYLRDLFVRKLGGKIE